MGSVGAGVFAGRAAFGGTTTGPCGSSPPRPSPAPIPATGIHQAGIAAPVVPQQFSLTVVVDVPGAGDPSFLPALGDQLLTLLDGGVHDAGDLTVTIGIGPRLVAAVDGALPAAGPLPAFLGDAELASDRAGGDLLLLASGSDPVVLPKAVDALLAVLSAPLPEGKERWRQFGFRGPGADGVVRNAFGFHDGIVVPRGEAELRENVWVQEDPRVAGGTVAVVRRLRMDTRAFTALPVAEQESAVGRRRSDGAPLSGGGRMAEVDLTAKTADGQYVTPLGSHARAAHPSTTGSALMLRRGYSYAEGDETGLMFISFQRDLRTFVATQHRLDEQDAMMRFVTPTASASFLVPPGFDRDRPLGASLLE
ncbi:Dyp-type peroxidase [Phytoactinopolyspora halotolerans]|uniref:Dyp-type peroxidase n=1 Tax=Phytoactinopolyspora halotolerans TaxID=1981512 RepID=UPI0035E41582